MKSEYLSDFVLWGSGILCKNQNNFVAILCEMKAPQNEPVREEKTVGLLVFHVT